MMEFERFKPSPSMLVKEILRVRQATTNPMKVQEAKARETISLASKSEKGKKLFKKGQGLERILDLEPFIYDMIKKDVEEAIITGNYAWSKNPIKYLFSTSGTSGKPKLIPATKMRDYTTFTEALAFSFFHPNKKIIFDAYRKGKTFFLPAKLIKENLNGVPVMNVSAYQAVMVPSLIKRKQLLKEEDFDMVSSEQRDHLLNKKALSSNISNGASASIFTDYRFWNLLKQNFSEYVKELPSGKRKEYLLGLDKNNLKIDSVWPNYKLISTYKSANNLHYLKLFLNEFENEPLVQEGGFNTSEGRMTIPSFFSNEINDNRAIIPINSNVYLGREVIRDDKKVFKKLGDNYLTVRELLEPGREVELYVSTLDLIYPVAQGIFLTGEPYKGLPTVSYIGRNGVSNLQNAHVRHKDLYEMPIKAMEESGVYFDNIVVTELEERLNGRTNSMKPRYQILVEGNDHSEEKIKRFLEEAEKELRNSPSITYKEVRDDHGNLGPVCLAYVKDKKLTDLDAENSVGQRKLEKFVSEEEMMEKGWKTHKEFYI